jgi:hypothetical protein
VQQAVAIREAEKVAVGHRALVAVVVRHHVAVDHAKVDHAVGLFVNQMHAAVHQLLRVLVENKLKAVRLFVNY